MLHVDLDNILTHDELASKADEVLRKADDEKKIVVITRNGRPAVAVLQLEMLEELSGKTVSPVQPPVVVPPLEPPAASPAPAPEPAVSTETHTDTTPMAEMSAPAPLPTSFPDIDDRSVTPPYASNPAPEQSTEQPNNTSGLPDMPDVP